MKSGPCTTASLVADAAEFFVRAVFAVRDGSGFRDAFARAVEEGRYDALDPGAALEAADAADPEDAVGTAKKMGLTCHTPEAFPLTLFFALRPGKGMLDTLSDNALAGGDNSARGMLLALLFAARGDRAHEELAKALAVFRGTSFTPGSKPSASTTRPGFSRLSNTRSRLSRWGRPITC